MLTRTVRYLLCAVAMFGGLYGMYVAIVCSLLCSSTYLVESNPVLLMIIVLSFYLGPFIGLAGGIMMGFGKRLGAVLMIICGVGMAYSYGIGNMSSVIFSAIPLLTAGGISFFWLSAEMGTLRKQVDVPNQKI